VRKIKEVLRLKFDVGLGLRQIARSCSIGLGTAHEYLQRAEAAKITWPLGPEWDDDRLERTRTSSSSDQREFARASLLALLRRRPAATDTPRSTLAPSRCFVIWRWRGRTAACAVYSRDSAASMSS
jgi:hypothetical protein